MAFIKPLDASAQKWHRRASVAGEDYQSGVENPRRSWSQASSEAESAYKTAVVQAANAGKYGVGIKKAGEQRWQENSKIKGVAHYPDGISLGVGNWQKGFAPYFDAIKSLTLPPRGPRRSPQNFERSRAVGMAAAALKERLGGGSK
jgi:hypothetical protein